MFYEELLKEADKLGIIVKECNLKTRKGHCYGKRIAIDKNLSNKEKYCVLAEELGHYKLTIGNITNQNKMSNKKQELLARKWGYKKNVGLLKLIEAFNNGCTNKHEIADFLNVTDKYLDEAIDYYRNKYGTDYIVDCYHIIFIPYLRIGKAFI